MTNSFPALRAKVEAIGAFLAGLPDPSIFCHFANPADSATEPQVTFFPAQHAEIWTALGPYGWRRQLSAKGNTYDFQLIVNGVLVELADAQPNPAMPLFASEVDPEFFTRREAALPIHSVTEVV